MIKARVKEFLEKYGDKGFIVLQTALEIALDGSRDRGLGDFSYRDLVLRLRVKGIEYNPSNLLRILEREYGIIEKAYSSSNQKWYVFIDLDTVRDSLNEYMGKGLSSEEEPRIKLLRIKYRTLEPSRLLKTLEPLVSKTTLSRSDKRLFKEIVYSDLDMVVELLEKMMDYEEYFKSEINTLNKILEYSSIIANKLEVSSRKPLLSIERFVKTT